MRVSESKASRLLSRSSPETAGSHPSRLEHPLPPNQQLAAPGKWPIVGEQSSQMTADPWGVAIEGLVTRPRSWSLNELQTLPQVERVIDIHCVTRWSKPGVRFAGVPLSTLLDACEPQPDARFISFVARSERNHSTSLPLSEALGLGTLVALTCEGVSLPPEHGGPVRTVVPGRYFYKSLKWLERIELLAQDRLGYWEAEAGYHNRADPWCEERYMAPNLDRREVARLLQARDFAERDLRSLDAAGMDLAGLNARGARLRDASFRRSNLRGADFTSANLSNAHLEGADLRDVCFRDADVEGADFRGADLRGADFRGASLFGATFVGEDALSDAARLGSSTQVEPESLAKLTPIQGAFVRAALRSTG